MTSTRRPRGVRTLRSVPTWPSSAGLLNPVTSVAAKVGRRLADQLGGLAPAAAEGQRDVVTLDAGDPCDVGGSLRRDGERVGGGVVERVVDLV